MCFVCVIVKSDFAANLEASIPVAFCKYDFVVQLDKPTLSLMSP